MEIFKVESYSFEETRDARDRKVVAVLYLIEIICIIFWPKVTILKKIFGISVLSILVFITWKLYKKDYGYYPINKNAP